MNQSRLLHSFSLTNGSWIDAYAGAVFVCFRAAAKPEITIKRSQVEVLEFFDGDAEVQNWLDTEAVELY